MLGGKDGESYSYLDLADIITSESVTPGQDREELYRRVAFSILVTNLDDQMRNHGFLRGRGGWHLSPAYDINPVPNQPRVLKSYVDDDNPDASQTLQKSRVAQPVNPTFELRALVAPKSLQKRNFRRRNATQKLTVSLKPALNLQRMN